MRKRNMLGMERNNILNHTFKHLLHWAYYCYFIMRSLLKKSRGENCRHLGADPCIIEIANQPHTTIYSTVEPFTQKLINAYLLHRDI